jgi:hypothetical protein
VPGRPARTIIPKIGIVRIDTLVFFPTTGMIVTTGTSGKVTWTSSVFADGKSFAAGDCRHQQKLRPVAARSAPAILERAWPVAASIMRSPPRGIIGPAPAMLVPLSAGFPGHASAGRLI